MVGLFPVQSGLIATRFGLIAIRFGFITTRFGLIAIRSGLITTTGGFITTNGGLLSKGIDFMAIARLSLAFRRLPDPDLHIFADRVFAGLTDNVSFPTLAADLPGLSASSAAFGLALVGIANGVGGAAMKAKVAARSALLALLRGLAASVEFVAKADAVMALSSGFHLASMNRAQLELAVPLILGIQNVDTGQLGLKLKPVKNARAYEIWLRVGEGQWWLAQTFANTRGVVLTGLVSGTLYQIRARAVGGRTGYSAFTLPTQRMCT
jgi:hypothetical protein